MIDDPIVMNVRPPRTPFKLPRLPGFSEHTTKLITVAAAVIICISMVLFVVFTALTNSSSFKKTHHIGTAVPIASPSTGVSQSSAALPGGGTAIGSGGTSSANSPVVSIKATPSSVVIGKFSHLEWSATNNPTSCTASDDWSGSKPANGEVNTQTLTKVQTYLFTLTCKNSQGTGFATVSVGATAQGGTGQIASRPTVTLAANPSALYIGDRSTLIWSTTNNPSSCTASGDWSGIKIGNGSEMSGILSAVKSYTYTLTCANAAGTGYATATVAAANPPADIPNVTISTSAFGSVAPGSSVTINWSVTNNPVSCTASGDWSGTKQASGQQNVGPLNSIKSYEFKLSCINSAGMSGSDSGVVVVVPNPPVVSLTASPAAIYAGSSATLSWSATNSPTSCTASGDWTGTKSASGTQSTGILNTIKTYTYSLTCTNDGGSGYANNIIVKVSAAPPPSPPVVSLSISPLSTTVGSSATLSWSATNSPTSCTASGDWTGTKSASGTQGTGVLSTSKTYSYQLSCNNAGGSNSASTSITVSQGAPTVVKPVVTIAVSPTSIGAGSSSTISWSAANSPASCTATGNWSGNKSASGSTSTGNMSPAGSYVFGLNCSNSAGVGSASATLTVIATPGISISVSPSSVTTGSSATISWNVTNSPSSCSAGGSWSGTKAASGTQSVAPSPAGSYVYSLSCTNAGGTTSNSTTLTATAPATVYCSGQTPCIGRSELATHATSSNCWGYNLTWVIDISSYAPHHKGGTSAGSLATAGSTCNSNIHTFLTGGAAISGYRDSGGNTTHGHSSTTYNNSGGSALGSYFKGYYDSTKP